MKKQGRNALFFCYKFLEIIADLRYNVYVLFTISGKYIVIIYYIAFWR